MPNSRQFLQQLPGNLFGGVTSAVVTLPMALAFGVASGLGPVAGIYGAVAVGFFAAVFGGTPSQISGPTGPMTVAMAAVVTVHAQDLGHAFTIVMLAGVLQMALGASRVGSLVSYTPYSVISGFMSGIGVIIILLQVIPFLGSEPVPGGPLNQIGAWPNALANANPDGIVLGAIALAICVFWPRKVRRFIPPALAALVVGTLAGLYFFEDADTIGTIPASLPALQVPLIGWSAVAGMIEPAIVIALLGSIDSLLTSLVADSLTRTRHNPNRELIGQGLGNLVAGLVGGLPGSGATMGTVTSIRSGGRSPVAGALGAMILLTLLLGAGRIAEPIPLAVLAGILISIGWDIIDWRFLTRVHRIRSEYVLTMFLTLLVTVLVDLISAVALGLIAAGLMRSKELERYELASVISVPVMNPAFFPKTQNLLDIDPYRMPVGLVRLKGHFSVASANELRRAIMADIEDHDVVILDFSNTTSLDASAALAIEQLIQSATDGHTACIVLGLKGDVADILHSLLVLRDIADERFADSLAEAIDIAQGILEEDGQHQ